MSALRLMAHQIRYDAISGIRNPPAVFFGLMLPIVFLLIFATVFGNEVVESRGGIRRATYYVPAIVAFGVIGATFMNLAIALCLLREGGFLKRLRGTPMPLRAFMAGRVASAIALAFGLTFVLVAIGWLLYRVEIPVATLPGVIVSLAIGAASFCCLGIALTAAIPNEDAAPPITNAIMLPLYFISGIFFPSAEAPGWLNDLASVFPVKHLAEALLTGFDPFAAPPGIAWGHLAVVAAWGILGLLLALRFFRWTPRAE